MEFYTCIAKYTFFGIRDEKLLATARKSWYHTMVCSGIEAVITGLTRNARDTVVIDLATKISRSVNLDKAFFNAS